MHAYVNALMVVTGWLKKSTEQSTLEPVSSIKLSCSTYGSYNMGTRDLPDIYAQARGPQARGCGHIYQENPECPRYN